MASDTGVDVGFDVGADVGFDVGVDSDAVFDAHFPACTTICALVAQVPCARMDDCLTACEHELYAGFCRNVTRTYYACAETKAVSDFYCSPRGITLIKPDVCVAEQDAIEVCIHTGRDPP